MIIPARYEIFDFKVDLNISNCVSRPEYVGACDIEEKENHVRQIRYWLVVVATVSAATANADIVIHELGGTAAETLRSLGHDFVTGCIIIAVAAVVVAALRLRRKG